MVLPWKEYLRAPATKCLAQQSAKADLPAPRWRPAALAGDLAVPETVDCICQDLCGPPWTCFIFTTATWESDADLRKIDSETSTILSVSAAAFVALARGLRDCLARSGNARGTTQSWGYTTRRRSTMMSEVKRDGRTVEHGILDGVSHARGQSCCRGWREAV